MEGGCAVRVQKKFFSFRELYLGTVFQRKILDKSIQASDVYFPLSFQYCSVLKSNMKLKLKQQCEKEECCFKTSA